MAAVRGTGDWQSGLIAVTRLAELRSKAYADSARRLRNQRSRPPGEIPVPGESWAQARGRGAVASGGHPRAPAGGQGDSAVLADILGRLQSKRYDHGDAWVLGRLGAGAADSLAARFLSADTRGVQGPLPDAALVFHRPVAGAAARPGLRGAGQLRPSQALCDPGLGRTAVDRDAGEPASVAGRTAAARARGVYDDPKSAAAASIFWATTAPSVISRTGKWLTEWVAELERWGDGRGADRCPVIPSGARDLPVVPERCGRPGHEQGPSLRSG